MLVVLLLSLLAAATQTFLLSFLFYNATNGLAFHFNFFGEQNGFLLKRKLIFQVLASPWSTNPTHCVGAYVLDHKWEKIYFRMEKLQEHMF